LSCSRSVAAFLPPFFPADFLAVMQLLRELQTSG
jgi:hypothetical protein